MTGRGGCVSGRGRWPVGGGLISRLVDDAHGSLLPVECLSDGGEGVVAAGWLDRRFVRAGGEGAPPDDVRTAGAFP